MAVTAAHTDGPQPTAARSRSTPVVVRETASAVQESIAPWWSQLRTMMGRNLRAWRRHPVMLLGEAVQYIFFGLFVGAPLVHP